MSDFAAQEGDILETVLLGGLLNRVLRYWTADGQPVLARVATPEVLAGRLARGVIARTGSEPGRYREVGLINTARAELMLMDRATLQPDATELEVGGLSVALVACDPPPPTEALWSAAVDWFGAAIRHAVDRGEFVVIEPAHGTRSQPHTRSAARAGVDTAPGCWGSDRRRRAARVAGAQRAVVHAGEPPRPAEPGPPGRDGPDRERRHRPTRCRGRRLQRVYEEFGPYLFKLAW